MNTTAAKQSLTTALRRVEEALARQSYNDLLAAVDVADGLGADRSYIAQRRAYALSGLDRHREALDVLDGWLATNPATHAIANMKGIVLKRTGRLQEALQALSEARRLNPEDVAPLHNMGNIYDLLGDHARAGDAYRQALAIKPESSEIWRLLARQQAMTGNTNGAYRSLMRARSLSPEDRSAATLLIQVLYRAGRTDEARAEVEALRETDPDDPELATIDARLSAHTGDVERARALLNEVIARAPGHLNANLALARIEGDGNREAANEAYARALEGAPTSFDVLIAYIESLNRSRYGNEADHIETAYELSKRLMKLHPARMKTAARSLRRMMVRVLDEERMAATGTLRELLPVWLDEGRHSAVNYELGRVESIEDRVRLVEWHRRWGRKVSARIKPVALPPAPALHSGRKLRVGFMSSDLRNHPVTYFTLPLLEGYDRDRVEVFCYSFCESPPDRAQDHIARNVTAFRLWPRKPDHEVAAGIASDSLDILFELGGSTAMNKLEVMAYRPARLGASWLGYPHSAGLEQIDLILTDPYLRPEDPRLLIERPLEMPETWVAISRMFAREEIAEGTPEARTGRLTFGTANNPYKYTPACLDAWAGVLRAVPGSRFLFLRPEAAADSFVANARAAFARRDVDPDRLAFTGVRGSHMRHYNDIDIALDSLPHVGGTTTCEALWMGVPTVSLVGPGFPERLSYSNLSNAGLGDLAVFSPEDYLAKAVELAEDRPRRTALRHEMRARIAAHPLGQPERFTRMFYELAARAASE